VSTDLLTTYEAAAILGCTPRYIAKLCKSGKIAAKQYSGRRGPWLVQRQEVERYQKERRPTGRPRKHEGE
jgi:excisionase family DNA binding protein